MSAKTLRQECAWNIQGRTKRLMRGELSGEKGRRCAEREPLRDSACYHQGREQRNDTSDSQLIGPIWMVIENRKMGIDRGRKTSQSNLGWG